GILFRHFRLHLIGHPSECGHAHAYSLTHPVTSPLRAPKRQAASRPPPGVWTKPVPGLAEMFLASNISRGAASILPSISDGSGRLPANTDSPAGNTGRPCW